MYDPQVYGLLGAVLLLHLGTLVYVYLRRSRGDGSPTPDVEAGVDRGADAGLDATAAADEEASTVVCDECGVQNAADYRFCRACVADLSGGAPRDGGEAFSNAA
jgi:hypothetical protein